MGTATIRDLIKRGDFNLIKEVMEKSRPLGMQTFDQALIDLVNEGAISEEEAVKNADSANNVRLKLKLHRDGEGGQAKPDDTSTWSLEPTMEEEEEQPFV
ncbi:hypothetical protein D3C85_610610 [compost metagenome]